MKEISTEDNQRISKEAEEYAKNKIAEASEKSGYIAGATRENERMAELLKDTVTALEIVVREIETLDGLGLDRIVLKMKAAIEKAKGKSQ